MEAAFLDLQNQITSEAMKKENSQWKKDIQLLYSYVEFKDKFTIQRIHRALYYYLDGRDCFGNKDYLKDVYYGIAIYDLVKEYINQILKKHYHFFDIRCFTLIYFHFRYLRLQAEFIMQNYNAVKENEFISKFLELEKYARDLLNIAIKYRISRKKEILQKIVIMLMNLKEEDIKILTQYTDYLKVLK